MYLRRVCIYRCGGIFVNVGQKCYSSVSGPSVVRESLTFQCRTRMMACTGNSAPERHTSYSSSNYKLIYNKCKEKSVKSISFFKNDCGNLYSTNKPKENRTVQLHSTFTTSILSMMIPHAVTLDKISKDFQERCCRFYCTSAGEYGNKEPDFEVLAKSVVEAARKINVMAGSIQIAKIVTLLKELHSRQIPLIPMEEILSQNLQMLQEADDVVKLTDLLISHGLNLDVVVHILRILPLDAGNISFHSVETMINNSLHNLRHLGFLENYINLLLISEPRILLVDSKTLNSVFIKLKGLFTTLDAIRVIQNSPNVLSDPWVETNKKFDYAYFTMGYKQQDIMRSRLFRHTLEHIQDRHIFLVRTGVFYPVKEKDDPRLNPNPTLRSVIDTTNELFAENFGGLSEEEFETYLLMREVEREDEGEASDETDEEENEEQLKTKSTRKNVKK